jgi:crotonobetainyl-CoA:carnitine CoA-transferase CaiB-like acyl-CoA transferase
MLSQVLAGKRVVELGCGMSGVITGRHLRDLGAVVTHVVERPCSACGDLCDLPDGLLADYLIGKEMVEVAVHDQRAMPALVGLLREADAVVIDGAVRGIGPQQVLDLAPRAAVLAFSTFGLPYDDGGCGGADGLAAEAATGVIGTMGLPDGPPLPFGFLFGEINAAVRGVAAVLDQLAGYALGNRGLERHERLIDLSLADCCLDAMDSTWEELAFGGRQLVRTGSDRGGLVPYGLFEGRDGHVGLVATGSWEVFARLMDRPDLAVDPRCNTIEARVANRPLVIDTIQAWVESQPSVDDVVRTFGNDTVAARMMTLDQVWDGEQMQLRGILAHDAAGNAYIAAPYRFEWPDGGCM